jgi:hypothetical protein
MDANESLYVFCRNGAFVLPEELFRSLQSLVTNGFVYLRQDDDVLTISTTRIVQGYRRVLNGRFRSPMFRNARQLAIMNLQESVRVMAIG